MKTKVYQYILVLLCFISAYSVANEEQKKKADPRAEYIRANYTKYEYKIPMQRARLWPLAPR